jgi:hypothetical protein
MSGRNIDPIFNAGSRAQIGSVRYIDWRGGSDRAIQTLTGRASRHIGLPHPGCRSLLRMLVPAERRANGRERRRWAIVPVPL